MKITWIIPLAALFGMLCTAHSSLAQELAFLTNSYPVGSGPCFGAASIADINGDGRLDLITGNYNSGTITVLTNAGGGEFGLYATLKVNSGPVGPSVVDIRGNGTLDIIVPCQGNNCLLVLTNDSLGNFASNTALPVGYAPQGFVAADINGDGFADLICACYTNIDDLIVYTNNARGGFVLASKLTAGGYVANVCAVDVNNDGFPDLVAANYPANSLTIMTNDGRGFFGHYSTLAVGKGPSVVIAADVNGDGKPDLITANNLTNTLTVLTNNGKGGFSLSATLVAAAQPEAVWAADIDGNGLLDLISANGGTYTTVPGVSNTVSVFTNAGGGTFGSNVLLKAGSGVDSVVAADLSGNGKLDLITANYNSSSTTVFINASVFPEATNRPSVALNVEGKRLHIIWPSDSAGWELQQINDVTRSNWLPSGYGAYTIWDNGANRSLLIPAPSRNLFFRLVHSQ